MDRLPPETQEQLRKMSFTCLIANLGKAGYDPDRLEKLERADLLEALAETMLAESETDLVREARKASSSKRDGQSESERSAKPREKRGRLPERQKKEKLLGRPRD